MAKYKIIPSSRTIVQSPISIGHKAEKGVEAIEFDLTAWVETYGSGTATIVMKRWGDSIPYPVALEIDENNKATWTLSDIDTAKTGMAYAQLNYIVGDEVVKKSDIYTFRVMDSLTGEGDPPEAYESWLEHLTHFAAEAMAEVLDIEGIVTDKTLTVDGGIADGKATGDALALKADKSTTYTKAEVDRMIEDVEVETDTTLSVPGAPADAKATGDALGALEDQFTEETDKLKADLVSDIFAVANLSDITDFSDSYILGAYSLTNGNFINTGSSVVEANQKAFELFSDEITICVADGMRVRGIILDPNKTYSAYFNWIAGGTSKPNALQNKKGYYIKPIIGKEDGTAITQEEASAYNADLFKILYPVETPIADKYDPVDSYANGDMCIYGGKLYKCKSDTTGTWDASKWEQTLVSTELRKDTKPVDDTTEKEYANVLAPDAMADNGYYFDFSDGITEVAVTNGIKTTADYINLGLIPSLHIRQTFDTTGTSTARIYVYFYSDASYLGYKQMYLKDIGADDYEMVTFAGATRIRLYVNNKNVTGDQICISTKRLDAFTPYGYTYKIKSSQLGLKLQGKVIVNFGDSIFGNKRPPNDISTEIARLTGATVYNCGFGGCRMAQASEKWNPFSMYSLADAIANNDFSAQDAIDIDTAGLPSYFKETRALLKNIDFSDVDIITIAYGTNDFTSSVVLDNNENLKDTTTFAGALRYSLETLWSAFPHLKIFICTPTYRFWMDNSNVFLYDSDTHEVGGQLLTQFVSKAIDVAKSYHVPYIDNYDIGINQFTRTAWFPSTDGTHHNYEGAKLIARHMANELY